MVKDRAREMIANPAGWPMEGVLALKRHRTPGRLPEVGVLLEEEVNSPVVYRSEGVGDLESAPFVLWQKQPQHHYNSVDAMLADGWLID